MKVWKSVTEQISFGGMKNRAYKLSGNRPGIIIQQDRKAGDAIWFFTQRSSHAWYELWIVKDIIAFRTKQCKTKCIVLPRLKLHLFHLNHPNTYRLSALAAANWEPKQIAKWVRNSVKKMTQESWTKRTLTGQISLHISSHVLIGFREITWWMEGGGGIFEKKKSIKVWYSSVCVQEPQRFASQGENDSNHKVNSLSYMPQCYPCRVCKLGQNKS